MPILPDFPVIFTSRGITQITPDHDTLCSKCAHAQVLLDVFHCLPCAEPSITGSTNAEIVNRSTVEDCAPDEWLLVDVWDES